MPTIQLRLWEELTRLDEVTKTKRDPVWYYVHDLVLDVMLTMADNGDWSWAAHDTIHDMPHLFNTRSLAYAQIGRLGHGAVKIYPWKLT